MSDLKADDESIAKHNIEVKFKAPLAQIEEQPDVEDK